MRAALMIRRHDEAAELPTPTAATRRRRDAERAAAADDADAERDTPPYAERY